MELSQLQNFRHRGEAVPQNTCANGIQVKKLKSITDYYRATVLQKYVIKQLHKTLFNSVNSQKILTTLTSTNDYSTVNSPYI